ncbi:hypothetical protein XFHB_10565 [Xylella fastidiosa]|uniref:Uncharacterized protein n=2 Tax=Xylella fastidiosa TaxID=2371 RepID=A0ABD7BY71_XYLFS|nr:hypothetical protein [Xylella fastidiosa]QPB72605.1 hypothetical protein XFHB_10565 [Xylella fastidiosa]
MTERRDAYIDDTLHNAVYNTASQTLRDAMVPRLPTGQRPGDVLAMDERHMVDGALEVCQAKTGAKVAMTEDYLRKHKGVRVTPT